MLKEVAEGVLVHRSEFAQSNAVVVHGRVGVLLVDAGVTAEEMTCLADDLRELDRPVVAGFSTHPHWDHLLWHAELGAVPRLGTARCAGTARERLSDAGAPARVRGLIPPDLVERVPLELLGDITGLPAGTVHVPWDGPRVRILEHDAHAPGHAALVIEESRVLVAGDMLSDVLVPMPDLSGADPIGDHLAALSLLESVVDEVDVVVPGHGSVAGPEQGRARIERDRAYVHALGDARDPDDARIGPSGTDGLSGVHHAQVRGLARRRERDTASG